MTQDARDLVAAGVYLAVVLSICCALLAGILVALPGVRTAATAAVGALFQATDPAADSVRDDAEFLAQDGTETIVPLPKRRPADEPFAQAEPAPAPSYGAWARAKARAALAAQRAKRKPDKPSRSIKPNRRKLPAKVYGSAAHAQTPRVWSYDPGRIY